MANKKGARALWITGPGRAEIREERLPEPVEDEVLVRTMYSAISRGTESLVFSGAVPPSEYGRMRAPFQVGEFPGPVKYGYINVGIVEHGPAALLGRAVFCLYPHQTHYVVAAAAVEPLPEELPPRRAVLAANLQAAVNGVWDAAPRAGDRIAVVGAGTLGCLAAWLAAGYPGCEVELVDLDPAKAAVAQALGVAFKLPREATREADIVIHASGTSEGLTTALGLAGFEATVTELSWFGDRRVSVPLGEAFHSQRLALKSSQVASIAPAQRARWTRQRQMQLVLRLLGDSRLDALITGESTFEELPDMLESVSHEPGGALCHLINYARHSSPT
ncbi:MAG: zinc-binding alcohol dehydrogenase [Gammaproteobacteria bacterium]|nr:zinc-binding alcohol dehydrogenase [Gammaproteobacteria bacterium]MDH3508062.1 zinc-binding alcohol dehydrogenase [Gammaproteobacteria bacterium]